MIPRLLHWVAPISLLFGGCKPNVLTTHQGYILGTNNIEKASAQNTRDIPTEVKRGVVLVSVEKSSVSSKFCSGILVAQKNPGENLRVLTNHHCFLDAERRSNAAETQTPLPNACERTKVYLNYREGELDQLKTARCKPDSLVSHFPSDLAVFQLDKNVDEKPLEISDEKGDIPRNGFIIHYPDVKENYVTGGSQAHLGLPVAAITKQDCRTLGNFSVDRWGFDRSLAFGMAHTCDLEQGSSGSPLISTVDFKVIGVNWGGITFKTDDKQEEINVATRAEFARKILDGDLGFLDTFYQNSRAEITKAQETKDREERLQRQPWRQGCSMVGQKP